MRRWLPLFVFAGLLLVPDPALAADHRNLEEGNPITVEDASVIAYRSIEQQPVLRYERGGERGEVFTLEPELKWGLIKNAQLEVKVPFFIGPGDREGSGNVQVAGLYNFNLETSLVPALALRVGLEFPSGEDASGVDSTVRGILTKGFARGRAHLNAGFTNRGDPGPGERASIYEVVVGVDHPADLGLLPIAIGLDNLVMVDVVVQRAAFTQGDPLVLAEAGLRHQVNPWALLTFGVGFGVAGESPDIQATIGYQYTFAAF